MMIVTREMRTAVVALAAWLVCWSVFVANTNAEEETTIFPTPSLSLSSMNSTVNSTSTTVPGNFSVNATSVVNATSKISVVMSTTTVLPTMATKISNVTTPKDNVFFVEFKLLSRQWGNALASKESSQFILLANAITAKVDHVYHSRNHSKYDGSRVIGYREGVYVSAKIVFTPGPVINASLLNPLTEFLRAGGMPGLTTDNVFMKISKYADCYIYYTDTTICHCPSKTYKMQLRCAEPDVNGGEPCPARCYVGEQVTGATLCSWDDLDLAKCSAKTLMPNIMLMAVILVLAVV